MPVAPPWFDSAAFVAQFAPDLSRTIGTRVQLRAAPAPEEAARLVRILEAQNSETGIALDLDRTMIALLLERMCGGGIQPGAAPRDVLSLLSPMAASWRGLSACLSQALRAGLAAAMAKAPPAALPVSRIEEVALDGPGTRLWYALGMDGASGWLALVVRDLAAEAAALPPGPGVQPLPETPSAWSERTARFLDDIELPVGVRLSEQRLPLASVLALAPGSILPIDRPRALVLIVDGKPWRQVETRQLESGQHGTGQHETGPIREQEGEDRP
jgi:flagellar motor switch/type III secretory pathway protein FliN